MLDLREVELSGGRTRYRDVGEGAPVVFIHGVFTDSRVWRKLETPVVTAGLRFIAPDLPLGSHVVPLNRDADQSPQGVAARIAEFLDALDLREATIVATDTGGALTQLLLARGCERIARVVLTPCDSFDNFLPPSIRALQYAARVPGVLALGLQPLRLRSVRRLVYRTLAKYGIPDHITASWTRPLLTNPGVRRDTARFLGSIDSRETLSAADTLRTLTKPVLLLWSRRAPYFPFSHAQRWTRILPDVRLVEITDSYTFVSEDQPELFARELTAFTHITCSSAAK